MDSVRGDHAFHGESFSRSEKEPATTATPVGSMGRDHGAQRCGCGSGDAGGLVVIVILVVVGMVLWWCCGGVCGACR